jgi:phosphatidylinositol alpha-mannosyltransferase
MSAATVFCAPSLGGESFGIILLEAMAAQTTVVASSISGYSQVANSPQGLAAELVEPGDPAALALALNKVLREPKLSGSLRAAGMVRAKEFDLELLCDKYLEIYSDLIAAAQQAPPKATSLRVRVR